MERPAELRHEATYMEHRSNLTPLHWESNTQRRINNGKGIIGETGTLSLLSKAEMDILIFAYNDLKGQFTIMTSLWNIFLLWNTLIKINRDWSF